MFSSVPARILWSDSDFVSYGESFQATVLPPEDTVVYVGPSIGVLSLLASRRLGPSGRVLAFEASHTHLALLNNMKGDAILMKVP